MKGPFADCSVDAVPKCIGLCECAFDEPIYKLKYSIDSIGNQVHLRIMHIHWMYVTQLNEW